MATADETQAAEQWGRLCEEFRAARDEEIEAMGRANRGFADFRPDINDVDAFNAAHERTEEVKRRMDDFIKAHFGRS